MRALALLALLGLGGCATLTADQCKVADWRALGVEDGALGYGESRFLEYADDCAKAGVTPDRTAWEAGRKDGLIQFCTPEGAYSAGVDGRPFKGRCTPETPDQLAALKKGQTYHAITDEIADLRYQIAELKQEIREINYEARRHRSSVTFSGIRSGALFGEIARLRHQIRHLRGERKAYQF